MKKLNWKIILSNISEAREELQSIESRIQSEKGFGEVEFQIALLHAYHHLNFAWNIRRVATKRYAHLTKKEFKKWGSYPKKIEDLYK